MYKSLDKTGSRHSAAVQEQAPEASQARIAAVLVLYKADQFLLHRLVRSIVPQVHKIFVVDNTPQNKTIPVALKSCGRPVFYSANNANMGLASAQNTGIRAAIDEGFTHVLLLDQDSAFPAGAVEGLLKAEQSLLESGVPVAAVGPMFIDEKTGDPSRGVRHSWLKVRWFEIPLSQKEPVATDYLIASGSLIRTTVLRQVGMMRDELFIDWVDTEWAYRASRFGFANYIVPTVTMKHSVGDNTGTFLGRRFNLHSPTRNYYIVRNAVYLLREPQMNLHWRLTMLLYVPKYVLVHSFLSADRWMSLRLMLRAIWEGATGNMRRVTAQ